MIDKSNGERELMIAYGRAISDYEHEMRKAILSPLTREVREAVTTASSRVDAALEMVRSMSRVLYASRCQQESNADREAAPCTERSAER